MVGHTSQDLAIRSIDGQNYSAAPLPASQALRVLVRLTKLVGETVLMIAAKGSKALEDIPADALQFAVQTLVDRLGEDDTERTIKELLATVRVADNDLTLDRIFDSHFQGRIVHMFRVLQYALEVNYRDFFDELRSRNIGGSEKKADTAA